jgi:hypothetical protein
MKKCPFCAEDIQDAAIVCKHCRRDLPEATKPASVGGVVVDEGFSAGKSAQPPRARSTPTPVRPTRPKQTSPAAIGCLFIVGIFVLLAVVGSLLDNGSSPSPSASPTTSTSSPAKAADNDAACRKDLKCWGEKHMVSASVYCKRFVERMAKNNFEWTDGLLEPKFSHYRWKDQAAGSVTYIGDKIKFQNGFGAWIYHTYECDLDASGKNVLDVRARPGRLN